MSFIVVVPAWKEDAHWSLLINNPYYQGHFVIDAADHSYCDGFQHENTLSSSSKGSLYRPAPFDTALFFLQNDQGNIDYFFSFLHDSWMRYKSFIYLLLYLFDMI